MQAHSSPMQNPYPTQRRQQQGYSYSGQGGGHGCHGPTGLQQQGTGTSTRHQHIPVLPKDPTPQLKNKLISLLKNIHQTGGLSTQKYKQLYPTSAVPPKFYGLPKIHKTGTPLRPIVSSRGSITYGIAKELSYIIKPLVGQSPHHLKNTQHFIQQLHGKKLEAGEIITSYDVKALFTPVPVQSAIQIVKQRLQQDTTLPQRTSMSIPQITSLLEFCLT